MLISDGLCGAVQSLFVLLLVLAFAVYLLCVEALFDAYASCCSL
jgi:hypothetical protein